MCDAEVKQFKYHANDTSSFVELVGICPNHLRRLSDLLILAAQIDTVKVQIYPNSSSDYLPIAKDVPYRLNRPNDGLTIFGVKHLDKELVEAAITGALSLMPTSKSAFNKNGKKANKNTE